MLRLNATVILLSLSEVEGYGRNHQPRGRDRRADTHQLSTTMFPETGWQSLYDAIDSLLTYPSDRSSLVLPQNPSTAAEEFEISTSGGSNGGGCCNDKNNNHNKAVKAYSVGISEATTLNTEQHTDPTGSTSTPRPPLPPPFAATPRASSSLYQPSTVCWRQVSLSSV
ncbi:hypothetical protein LX36DRAFT_474555 [Colletotrichum falcatum]|nr:hypothetical protein LX36DRAFT_474555 [Colletotrichum falcatum]